MAALVSWQYGQTAGAGAGVDQLDGPTSADVLPNGNVAICDAGNHRVIVVRAGDFKGTSGGADAGFSASSIVWQYGQTGVSGDGVDQLKRPTSVQALIAGASQGNLLICDQGAQRRIEVRAQDYAHGFTDKSIVWQFPASGAGSGASSLSAPSCALGNNGSDNLVWIADAGRVLGVATDSISGRPGRHVVFAEYGPSDGTPFSGSLSAPASLSQAGNGSLVVADPGGHRVVDIGTTADSAVVVQSVNLNGGLAIRKQFVSIRCTYRAVPGAQITVSYLIDGGAPRSFSASSAAGPTYGRAPRRKPSSSHRRRSAPASSTRSR